MYYAGDLRKAETKGVGRVRQAMDRAREEWTDAERRIRQRMRVYPQKLRNLVTRSSEETLGELERPAGTVLQMGNITPQPTKIVSIHGQDVDEKELG
jgi:hypothetical protein